MESIDRIQPLNYISTVCIFLGLWNPKDSWTLKNILHFIACPGFYVMGFFVLMLIELLNVETVEEATSRLNINVTMATLTLKLINFVVKRRKFSEFINKMESSLVKPKNKEEIAFIRNRYNSFNRLTRIFVVSAIGALTGNLLGSLFSGYQRLPYPARFPFNWRKNTAYYWVAFIYEAVGMACSATTNTIFDFANGYLFLQVSIYYRLICMRLEKIGHEPFEDDLSTPREDSIAELKKCIQMHQFVTNLAQCTQDIWTVALFIQLGVGGTVICFSAYQLTILSPINDTSVFISCIMFLGAMILQIFLPCYYGHELTESSGLVLTAVYSSNWTEMPKEYKKLMFCFMESLKRPKLVLAGGYIIVGIQTMTSVFQSEYSLFAVVMNMKN